MAMDFRNYQLLTSGVVANNTPIIIDTNYDPSYWVFNLKLFALTPNLAINHTALMQFNNDNSLYTNIASAATNGVVLTNDVSNTWSDQLFLDVDIFWPPDNSISSGIFVNGWSTYRSLPTGFVSYKVFAEYGRPLPITPSPFLTIVDSFGSTFMTGFYLMYGIIGRGATLLSTSQVGA